MTTISQSVLSKHSRLEEQVDALLQEMTLAEKVGQMAQVNIGDGHDGADRHNDLRAGRVGSLLNVVDVHVVNELQRIAVEESRLGVPLLIGRDVIHGFHTVMPIPLGQAASFNPCLVRQGAAVAAREAATCGINWTFAPMIDISRDARWGRIAESLGEDPFLASELGRAMIEGFQGEDLASASSIAACGKHFAGYGASEAGRDYSTTNIPENELRNVYLPPFKAAVDAGVVSLMTSFSDLDGVPASANTFLLRDVLRDEWAFDGLVVSDWDSVRQLQIHGLTANDRESASEAITAGVDMEMHGDAYIAHLESLIADGNIDAGLIDLAAANILRAKIRLGLFDNPYTDSSNLPSTGNADALSVAREAALESVVLLKNAHGVLPLQQHALQSIAVIGPLADEPIQQLGTWIFDGDPALSVTPLTAIASVFPGSVSSVRAMHTSRSCDQGGFDEAVAAAEAADVAVLFLGEESILSGEAHSRADISLPGAQAELVRRIRQTGKPVVAVIQAGRPLVLTNILDEVDAILFAWHAGSMAGPAIADLLFGHASPSAKLPATFPNMVGQIPIYYNHKNTGKPPSPHTVELIDEIDANATQLSTGMTAYHMDAGYLPLFPFGFGLSYAEFAYSNLALSTHELRKGEALLASVDLTNHGSIAGQEVVQLYVRDVVGNVTRPVKELKGFQKLRLQPGESRRVEFELSTEDLSFYARDMQRRAEAGEFHLWIGGDSNAELQCAFYLVD